MQYRKWMGILLFIILVISCLMPWVTVVSKQIVISGVSAEGTNFGKPGYFNLLFSVFFLFFHLVPRLWAKRWNLLVVALNIAWAIRNYFLITACREGECPQKHEGLYLMLFAAAGMLISALFPDIRLNGRADEKKD